jgi:presenilin 1
VRWLFENVQVVAFAAYMAIIAGLAMTLLLLALYQKALPALPISIFLGVAFYLLGRLLLDPFIAGAYSNLVYF